MKLFGIIIIFLATTSCYNTSLLKSKVVFETLKTNKSPQHFEKILIVGFGHSATRLFFDKLNVILRKDFVTHKIETQKHFLGSDSVLINTNFKKLLDTAKYDAVLLIIPKSNIIATETYDDFGFFQHREIMMDQKLKLTLLKKDSLKVPLWQASMKLDIKFTKESDYIKISDSIMHKLKINFIIQ